MEGELSIALKRGKGIKLLKQKKCSEKMLLHCSADRGEVRLCSDLITVWIILSTSRLILDENKKTQINRIIEIKPQKLSGLPESR